MIFPNPGEKVYSKTGWGPWSDTPGSATVDSVVMNGMEFSVEWYL